MTLIATTQPDYPQTPESDIRQHIAMESIRNELASHWWHLSISSTFTLYTEDGEEAWILMLPYISLHRIRLKWVDSMVDRTCSILN